MTPHEWKVLGSFGLLALGLGMVDAGLATKIVGIAVVVIVVKNADKLPVLGGHPAAPGRAAPGSNLRRGLPV